MYIYDLKHFLKISVHNSWVDAVGIMTIIYSDYLVCGHNVENISVIYLYNTEY